MKINVYIYFRGKVRGPFDIWELKLIASKYRDFHVYLGCNKWIAYNEWDKSDNSILCNSPPLCEPEILDSFKVELLRFIKRTIFRDHH